MARRGETSAVFVANDQMAIGVLHAFAEAGLVVPRDVSVVGFDDIPEAGYLNPALTTVRQDFQAIGRGPSTWSPPPWTARPRTSPCYPPN